MYHVYTVQQNHHLRKVFVILIISHTFLFYFQEAIYHYILPYKNVWLDQLLRKQAELDITIRHVPFSLDPKQPPANETMHCVLRIPSQQFVPKLPIYLWFIHYQWLSCIMHKHFWVMIYCQPAYKDQNVGNNSGTGLGDNVWITYSTIVSKCGLHSCQHCVHCLCPTNTFHFFAFFFFLGVIVILVLLPMQCFLHHCWCRLPFSLYGLCKCGIRDNHDLHLQFHQTMPECVAVVMKSLDTGIKHQTTCIVVLLCLIVDCHI